MQFLRTAAPCAAVIVGMLSAASNAGSIRPGQERLEHQAVAALHFYEHEVALRNLAPAKFDRVHPLGGRLLASEAVYEKLLKEWEEHPLRFEHNHECVWRVLYGDLIYHRLHAHEALSPPPYSDTITTWTSDPTGPGEHHDPPKTPPAVVIVTSVPEPSTGALVASGLIFVALAAARRRACAIAAAPTSAGQVWRALRDGLVRLIDCRARDG